MEKPTMKTGRSAEVLYKERVVRRNALAVLLFDKTDYWKGRIVKMQTAISSSGV